MTQPDDGRTAARTYVDAIIEINREYGAAPDVTPELYDEVVEKLEQGSRRLIELQDEAQTEREKALAE